MPNGKGFFVSVCFMYVHSGNVKNIDVIGRAFPSLKREECSMNLFIAAKEKFMEDYNMQLETERKQEVQQSADGYNQLNQTENAAKWLK